MRTSQVVILFAAFAGINSLPNANLKRQDDYCEATAQQPCDPSLEKICCSDDETLNVCVYHVPTKQDTGLGYWSTTTCAREGSCQQVNGYWTCVAP